MTKSHSVNLRKLEYSPQLNPFFEPVTVEVKAHSKRRYVRTGSGQELVDPATGEVKAVAMIHTVEEKDDEGFVKVFAEGVKAAFGLGRTAARVFQAVLAAYEQEKMTGGFADSVNLFWFDTGINGEAIGMSEYTFHRGLKELIEKGFLRPKMPNQFWVNPALFFKGDRVAFIKEYRRKAPPKAITKENAHAEN